MGAHGNGEVRGSSLTPKLDELGVRFTEAINAIQDLPMSDVGKSEAIAIIKSHYQTAIEAAKTVGKR